MSELIQLSVEAATDLASAAFVAAGMSNQAARRSAWPLIEAEAMGISTHGLVRVPIYVERMRLGGVNPVARIESTHSGPALALVDGDNAVGTLVMDTALDTALEMVAESGIAYVGSRRSNHCGALMPYGFKACAAGYLLLGGTNASPSMAPWGGSEARLANNPLCIAAPIGDGPHFLLDIAMSVAARGKIRAARDAGLVIPDTWAVDARGRPTTDPLAALSGFLAPMGGHKGSGLSQAIDILSGVLTGAQFLTGVPSWMENPQVPSSLGHFILLLDPARLIGKTAYDEAIGRFRDVVRQTPPADTAQAVLLPGQAEQARRDQAAESGLQLPLKLVDEIAGLGR